MSHMERTGTHPSCVLVTKATGGLMTISSSSCESFRAAALTSLGDLRPILGREREGEREERERERERGGGGRGKGEGEEKSPKNQQCKF